MERDENLNEAVRKGLLALVVIALVIAIGTFAMVKLLGLDSTESEGGQTDTPAAPSAPLPTTALPVPGEKDSPVATPEVEETTEEPGAKGLQISITPVFVRPMERINITGTYQGMDAVQLQVQRQENGGWSDFPTETTVRAGRFSTYVMTGRTGDNKFRVFDPNEGKASNAIVVTVK